jgi:hypothetical protein
MTMESRKTEFQRATLDKRKEDAAKRRAEADARFAKMKADMAAKKAEWTPGSPR